MAVTAGDLIVVMGKWEGVSTGDTTMSCADGGVNTYTEISFTGGHPNTGVGGSEEPWNCAFWAVAATTTSITPQLTWAAARSWRSILAICMHPDAAGTISLDGTPTGSGAISGSITTGNITTSTQATNCGLAVVSYSEYGDNPTAEQINGTAADSITNETGNELWTLRYTNGFTGQGTATIGFNHWSAGIFAFKIVAGGGGSPVLMGQACL
jgi:hypothetical protein